MSDPTWNDVKKRASEYIERSGAKVKTHGLDPADTEYHRGILAAMDAILSLEDKRKEIPGFALDV